MHIGKKILAVALAVAMLASPAFAHDFNRRGASATSVSDSGASGGTQAGSATLGNGFAGAEAYNGQVASNQGYASGYADLNSASTSTYNGSTVEGLSEGNTFSLGNGGAVALGGGFGGAGGFSDASAWTRTRHH